MKKLEEESQHPNILDRNRAILLSRDLLNLNDWVLLALKQSKLTDHRAIPGDSDELVTITVIGPGEKVLMDMLIRPDGAVKSELLHLHGCNQVQASKAPLFEEVHKILHAGFRKTRVLCYKPAKAKEILSTLCKKEKLAPLEASYIDVQLVYSRFLGEKESETKAGYKAQPLPKKHDAAQTGVSSLAECKYVLHLLQEMAGSDQHYDSAVAFSKGWSATFYKPKHGPADKIKELLGLNNE